MRLLVVTHNYPRFPGDPAGAFVARLATEVARGGHDVHVVAPHTEGTAPLERRDGVSLHRFRYAPARWERVGYRGDLHRQPLLAPVVALGVPAFLASFALAVRRAIREFRPDIVHAHWWFPSAALVPAAAAAPLVVTSHGSDVRLLERHPILRRLGRRVFGRAAAVTAVSRFLAEEIRRSVPELGDRLHIAPMPVDVALFATGRTVQKSDPPRILYAGNLIPSKGVSDLVQSVALLRRRGIQCGLKILGEGPALADLRAEATRAGIDEWVQWSRFVPQAAMPAEYGASTVTVLPTRGRDEGLGLTLVEALLAGSAVVGTTAGGIPEVVVDGETGLLARSADPEDLASKIGSLLANAGLRERLSTEGCRRMQHTYDARSASERFMHIYDAVLHSGSTLGAASGL